MAKCAIRPSPTKSTTTFRSRASSCNTGLQQYHAANAPLMCHRKPFSKSGLPRTCNHCSGMKSAKNDGSSAKDASPRLGNHPLESRPRGNLPHASLPFSRKVERTAVWLLAFIDTGGTRIISAIMCDGGSVWVVLWI